MEWSPEGVGRRQFLQAAAFGAAGAVMPTSVLRYLDSTGMVPPATNDPELFKTFEGTLVGLKGGRMDLMVDGRVHSLQFERQPSVWRGGAAAVSDLRQGDAVLVRLSDSWKVSAAWDNLTRVTGKVTNQSSSGLVVDGLAGPVHVTTNGRTQAVDSLDPAGGGRSSEVRAGDWIDVIGLANSVNDVTGTLMAYANPAKAAAAQPQQDAGTLDALAAAASFSVKGRATWFNCSTGAGKCGTCNTSKNNQAAWPDTSNSNGTGRCAFDGCLGDYPNKLCGDAITVTPCAGSSVTLAIVDCGPCQRSGCPSGVCAGTCNNPSTCSPVTGTVVDLTKPTFARFYNPASFGCFIATVQG